MKKIKHSGEGTLLLIAPIFNEVAELMELPNRFEETGENRLNENTLRTLSKVILHVSSGSRVKKKFSI